MVNLVSTRTPRSFSVKLLSSWVGPQHILVHGVVPPQVQDLALAFVELHEVPVSPFLQLVEVTLHGSTTLWCISDSSQFVISKLAEGILCLIIQIIIKMLNSA